MVMKMPFADTLEEFVNQAKEPNLINNVNIKRIATIVTDIIDFVNCNFSFIALLKILKIFYQEKS